MNAKRRYKEMDREYDPYYWHFTDRENKGFFIRIWLHKEIRRSTLFDILVTSEGTAFHLSQDGLQIGTRVWPSTSK